MVGLCRHPVDSRDSLFFCFVFVVFTGVALTPSVVYLCITLFTELFNLAGGDVAVLVAVPTLVQSQATADPTLPGSCTMTRHAFNPHTAPQRRFQAEQSRAGVEAKEQHKHAFISAQPRRQLGGISLVNVTQR